jgi:cytochrome c peroxidase
MTTLKRATPTIVNTVFNELQMWDGRFHSLEEQAVGPMQAPGEMNSTMDDILSKLKSMPGYVQAFDQTYPGEGITKDTVAKAVASLERTIVSQGAPFDAWVHGKNTAISPSAQRSFDLFTGKANCVACHSGPNFTDEGFHNIGLNGDDVGRFAMLPIKISKGAFKTPTLRDIALTAPYMHNGACRTLEVGHRPLRPWRRQQGQSRSQHPCLGSDAAGKERSSAIPEDVIRQTNGDYRA